MRAGLDASAAGDPAVLSDDTRERRRLTRRVGRLTEQVVAEVVDDAGERSEAEAAVYRRLRHLMLELRVRREGCRALAIALPFIAGATWCFIWWLGLSFEGGVTLLLLVLGWPVFAFVEAFVGLLRQAWELDRVYFARERRDAVQANAAYYRLLGELDRPRPSGWRAFVGNLTLMLTVWSLFGLGIVWLLRWMDG